jgi:hypothetical protein
MCRETIEKQQELFFDACRGKGFKEEVDSVAENSFNNSNGAWQADFFGLNHVF